MYSVIPIPIPIPGIGIGIGIGYIGYTDIGRSLSVMQDPGGQYGNI